MCLCGDDLDLLDVGHDGVLDVDRLQPCGAFDVDFLNGDRALDVDRLWVSEGVLVAEPLDADLQKGGEDLDVDRCRDINGCLDDEDLGLS